MLWLLTQLASVSRVTGARTIATLSKAVVDENFSSLVYSTSTTRRIRLSFSNRSAAAVKSLHIWTSSSTAWWFLEVRSMSLMAAVWPDGFEAKNTLPWPPLPRGSPSVHLPIVLAVDKGCWHVYVDKEAQILLVT